MNSRYAVILLASSNHALKAEKLLIQAGIACKLIPVPRQLSSECGVCLRIAAADRPAVLALFSIRQVETVGIVAI